MCMPSGGGAPGAIVKSSAPRGPQVGMPSTELLVPAERGEDRGVERAAGLEVGDREGQVVDADAAGSSAGPGAVR